MTINSIMPPLDPAEAKDYKFDFMGYTHGVPGAESDLLESGETINSYTLTSMTGITVDSDQLADGATSVVVWVSGGTVGEIYWLDCKVVTTLGRTYSRKMYIPVLNL